MAKTKIVATLGPASNSAESIEALLRAGADVFRLNFSHGTEEEHRRTLQAVREACARTGLDAALLGDLPGPKIRLGRLDPSPLMLREGQRFFLAAGEFAGSAEGAAIAYPHLARDIAAGDHIALNDGMALLRVVENRAGRLE